MWDGVWQCIIHWIMNSNFTNSWEWPQHQWTSGCLTTTGLIGSQSKGLQKPWTSSTRATIIFFFESVMFAWHIGELPGTKHAPWISLRVAKHLLSTFFFTDSQIAADSGEGCTNAWSNTHTLDNRASQRFWLQILSAYPSRRPSTAGWVHDVRCEN